MRIDRINAGIGGIIERIKRIDRQTRLLVEIRIERINVILAVLSVFNVKTTSDGRTDGQTLDQGRTDT